MKRFQLLFWILSLSFTVLAQETGTEQTNTVESDQDKLARTNTESLTAKYSLNADQAKQMYTIQLRKLQILASIEKYKTDDPAKYRTKLASAQKGTLGSIRRILRTKEQVALYQRTVKEVRVLRAEKKKQLLTDKASPESIETALLDLYIE